MAKRKRQSGEPALFEQPMTGAIAICERCKEKCRVGIPKNKEARLLKLAARPEGLCANCAVTEWLVKPPAS